MEILQYLKRYCPGIESVLVDDISALDLFSPSINDALKMDCLWLCGNALNEERHCGWSGFMERATLRSKPYHISSVTPSPFVNLDPTEVRAIYTAEMVAVNNCHERKQTS